MHIFGKDSSSSSSSSDEEEKNNNNSVSLGSKSLKEIAGSYAIIPNCKYHHPDNLKLYYRKPSW